MHGHRHGRALVLILKTRPNESAATKAPVAHPLMPWLKIHATPKMTIEWHCPDGAAAYLNSHLWAHKHVQCLELTLSLTPARAIHLNMKTNQLKCPLLRLKSMQTIQLRSIMIKSPNGHRLFNLSNRKQQLVHMPTRSPVMINGTFHVCVEYVLALRN